jgi:2-polyprenyl-6-methoxyphenol hydroxylase-like FAD-dependent oxidoreductase
MSFKRVVILGAGPVGLLCAIEARMNFVKDVTLVEKRSDYSRTNVPVLDPDIRNHFKKLGVTKQMEIGKDWAQPGKDAAAFSKIEKALLDKATSLGVQIERPYVVSGAIGAGMNKHGRYKSVALFLAEWDNKNKQKLNKPGKRIEADLVIVATGGGGTATDSVIVQTLGFSYERLKAKNYGAYAIFDPASTVTNPQPLRAEDRPALITAAKKDVAGYWIHIPTPEHKYLLTTLSGITPEEFKVLKGSVKKLRDVLETINKIGENSVLEDIKEVQNNVGIFKIAIQRVRQMYSNVYPAVIVGDAAVTPHPEKGSGYTTGFRGFEELQILFQSLKETDRSKDNSIAFQSFNDRYELHVSKKAIEGTFTVLYNVKKMVTSYISENTQILPTLKLKAARAYVQDDIDRAQGLSKELKREEDLARKLHDYLEKAEGEELPVFGWDETAGKLWKAIAVTWYGVKALMIGVSHLDDRLDSLKGAIKAG